jgi:hypothetical protein
MSRPTISAAASILGALALFYFAGVWPWLGSNHVAPFWTPVTASVVAVLGGVVAIFPPEKRQVWLKIFLVVFFLSSASLGTRSELQLRATEENNRKQYESDQKEAQRQQTNAEIRFSSDLAAVKGSSDAILRFVANPPPGLSQSQISSTLSDLLTKRDEAAPTDVCDLSNNGLRTMGQSLIPVLKEKAHAWQVVADSVEFLSALTPEERESRLAKFKEFNNSLKTDPANELLFAKGNHLADCVSIRLGKPAPERQTFHADLGWKGLFMESYTLQTRIDQLPKM